jgi:signal transduction histidine kinase
MKSWLSNSAVLRALVTFIHISLIVSLLLGLLTAVVSHNDILALQRSVCLLFIVTSIILIARERHVNDKSLPTNPSITIDSGELVRVLCHDLGNTLTMILGCASKGSELDLSEEGAFVKNEILWNRVQKAGQTQKDIITQVRHFERAQAGKFHFSLVPVNLASVIENAKEAYQEPLEKKRLKLLCNLEKDSPLTVLAEPVTLTNHVFYNLISNAIKFSYEGDKIEIFVKQTETKTIITVRDYGMGMTKDLVENIFRPEIKTSRPGTLGEKGTGFGMPIVKSYMNLFNAELSLESRLKEHDPEKHGTTFTLSFLNH